MSRIADQQTTFVVLNPEKPEGQITQAASELPFVSVVGDEKRPIVFSILYLPGSAQGCLGAVTYDPRRLARAQQRCIANRAAIRSPHVKWEQKSPAISCLASFSTEV